MFGKSEVFEAGEIVRLLVVHIYLSPLTSPPLLCRGLCFLGEMTQNSFPSVLSAAPLTLNGEVPPG